MNAVSRLGKLAASLPGAAALAVALALPLCAGVAARADELDPQLNERVLKLPGDPSRPVALQVTVFTPPGSGPFPLAVINHGKNLGDPRNDPRWRAPSASRYFLARGYAVAVPMARGFAGSGGVFDGQGCDVEDDGIAKARDVLGVIYALEKEPFVDPARVVVVGQSYGGWTTLALGTLEVPGLKALANFAGGRRATLCTNFKSDLVTAAGHFARRTHTPSIWFYGDNDELFSPDVWRPMFDAYQANGGKGELVAYGRFGKDAHMFLASPDALSIWAPKMDAFLSAQGLPTGIVQPQLQQGATQ